MAFHLKMAAVGAGQLVALLLVSAFFAHSEGTSGGCTLYAYSNFQGNDIGPPSPLLGFKNIFECANWCAFYNPPQGHQPCMGFGYYEVDSQIRCYPKTQMSNLVARPEGGVSVVLSSPGSNCSNLFTPVLNY